MDIFEDKFLTDLLNKLEACQRDAEICLNPNEYMIRKEEIRVLSYVASAYQEYLSHERAKNSKQ